MDRASPVNYGEAVEEEIGTGMYVALGIALLTVVTMYGWMGYTLFSTYLDEQARAAIKAKKESEAKSS
eukprot:CAMPEP_0172602706 /NCGR_PEP_ID=MMETSP1068-20121228/22887_1 /TAXON_ID=35684 /ORGANISM="Pseudopedinella elastica, Strain CCMP716" /LENGTH=67 /DNA_ID=CAMNT_0013404157 /DNA_START=119 /DNA_END=322 /DNA_ORIENTATION=+